MPSLRFSYLLPGVGRPAVKEPPRSYCLFLVPHRESRLLYISTSATMGELRSCRLECVQRRQHDETMLFMFPHCSNYFPLWARPPSVKELCPFVIVCSSRPREMGKMYYIIHEINGWVRGPTTQPNILVVTPAASKQPPSSLPTSACRLVRLFLSACLSLVFPLGE